MTKTIKFKVFPISGHKIYYDVIICKNKEEMVMRSFGLDGVVRDNAQAITHSRVSAKIIGGKEVPDNKIGTILFYNGGLS